MDKTLRASLNDENLDLIIIDITFLVIYAITFVIFQIASFRSLRDKEHRTLMNALSATFISLTLLCN
jgi:hypothetical protein